MSSVPILEATDYPELSLGYADASFISVDIVGLDVKVYGLKEVESSTLPLAAVIATHGRCNNQKQMRHFANGLLGHIFVIGKDKPRKRDTIVVTVDQRNHGERTVNRTSNLSYDKNPKHLVDMAACIVGGCQDVSYIIDFLASYLFPQGEKEITSWIATGISLGGNLTYRLLQTEPRIDIAIPIIGLPWPSFPVYLKARALSMGLDFAPPLYPPALRQILETPPPAGCFDGKKILSIHGASDTLVPFDQGAAHIAEIQRQVESGGKGGVMDVWKKQGVGHAVTPDMLERTGEWVWRHALSE